MFVRERAAAFLCMHSLQEGVLVGRNAFLKGAFFEGFLLFLRCKSKPKQPFKEYLHKLVNSVYCDVVKDVLVLARYIGLSSAYRRTVHTFYKESLHFLRAAEGFSCRMKRSH